MSSKKVILHLCADTGKRFGNNILTNGGDMSGTSTGGKKAAAKNKSNNPNYYAIIGAKGGKSNKGSKS